MTIEQDIKGIAIYVRSSKDRHDVSCEAQRAELQEYAISKGYNQIHIFEDKALSSTRDIRPQFDDMVGQATSANPPFKTILCKDTSRFGRDSTEKNVLLWQLRKKHGIEVVFKDMPHTGSFMDEAFEQIMSAMDYIHSQQSKVKGVASMKQNVRNGYRAGGQAPFGYQLENITIGQHRNGDTITKTKLTPDPETAPFAWEYFERRAKNEPRRAILTDFHRRGVPTPAGSSHWAVSTAKSMEDNIDTYLGHTVFNRHNERLKKNGKSDGYKEGKKFRDREEWVITENTHEPLVSEKIAQIIMNNKEKGLRDSPYNTKTYPLTGILKCDVCGSNFTGDSGYYRCNSKSVIGSRCVNNGIAQGKIEQVLIALLTQVVLKVGTLQRVIDKIHQRFSTVDTSRLTAITKQLEDVADQRKKLIALHMKNLIDEGELAAELKILNEKKADLEQNIAAEKAESQVSEISKDDIREVINNLSQEIKYASPEKLRMVFNNLFQEIKISPKTQKPKKPWSRLLLLKGISVSFTGVKVASPRGFEPLSQA
ncbi:recombinase family protein [Desulfobacter postgatei]|uniref:recombinase family protein n=1 Tax=Desulfobacter postgatei TaxID=2293 RepID=UPI000232C2A0